MGPTLRYKDTSAWMAHHTHGAFSPKTGIVLHETVSHDIPGWADIDDVELFLAAKNYGIHGMTDAEGHIAWAYGLGSAIFWQAGGANSPTIGIEQVSDIMIRSPKNTVRRKIWTARQAQLRATAKLIAAIHNTKPHDIPLKFWDGSPGGKGITAHYCISQHHKESEGHTDCWPVHLGGYYPMFEVIYLAKTYAATGLHL